jgi:hypothetical protein
MLSTHRRRRGPYALAGADRRRRGGSALVFLGFLALAAFVLYSLFGWLFGGATTQRAPARIAVERSGEVNVTIDGGEVQQAEDGLPLYGGDSVSTTTRGQAQLAYFDGTVVRLDVDSELKIVDSQAGEEAVLSLLLTRGRAWLRSPLVSTQTGVILRTIETPGLSLQVPAGTEMIVSLREVAVFDAGGPGVPLELPAGGSLVLGEGQVFSLPSGDASPSADIYAYRSALRDIDLESAFLADSRRLVTGAMATATSSALRPSTEVLEVQEPVDGSTETGATLVVRGTVGQGVSRVRVNGYQASLDAVRATFRQELALPTDVDAFEVVVEALDERGIVLREVQRTVRPGARVVTTVSPLTLLQPAAAGQTYRTSRSEVTLRGTAGREVQAIEVNGYRLQLFTPGSGTWSYLAREDLRNLVPGRNVYTILPYLADGKAAAPVTLVILKEDGAEGIVTSASSVASTTTSVASSTTSSSSSLREADLPQNAPLLPGSLAVTAPTAGTAHTATGSELLLEGTTSSQTASVWVNGYRLQLYQPGVRSWNYIAKEAFGNLKDGLNTYRIVARNEKGEVLDVVEYVVTKAGA